MKKIKKSSRISFLITAIVFISFFFTDDSFSQPNASFLPLEVGNVWVSQDTAIVKYLPLKVGNVWVYDNGGWGIGKARLTITGSHNANGHVYYIFSTAGDPCQCAQGSYFPFLTGVAAGLRIDSLNGNIMHFGDTCQWHINETLLDSLRTPVGGANYNACNYTYCYDTNTQNVFGVLRKTRNVGLNVMTYLSMRRYAYGIGLISSGKGCWHSGCGFTLLGCVIEGILYGDTTFPVGVKKISSEIPEEFKLFQNYPNPFNPVTSVKFQVSKMSEVRLIIYDVLGSEVTTLVNEELKAGTYEVEFDGTNYPSGVYFYTFAAGELTETRKMLLIK